jgi:uncharacterized protein (TIGR00369 family)
MLVGPFWERRVDGGIQIGLVCDARHDNGRGNMHGGVLMTLADLGMGAAARSGGDDVQCATVQLDVAFMQAVDIGEFVTTECHIRHQTRRLIFVSGMLKAGGKAVASAQGVFKALAKRRADLTPCSEPKVSSTENSEIRPFCRSLAKLV